MNLLVFTVRYIFDGYAKENNSYTNIDDTTAVQVFLIIKHYGD